MTRCETFINRCSDPVHNHFHDFFLDYERRKGPKPGRFEEFAQAYASAYRETIRRGMRYFIEERLRHRASRKCTRLHDIERYPAEGCGPHGVYFVTSYLATQVRGGPEEGGWYYYQQWPLHSTPIPWDDWALIETTCVVQQEEMEAEHQPPNRYPRDKDYVWTQVELVSCCDADMRRRRYE